MPDFTWENKHAPGPVCGPVCGIDEVGRGPLAGPVVAAAVILQRDAPKSLLTALDDSKKLTAKKRALLAAALPEYSHISIALCEAEEIDRINILQASLLAMKKAAEGLSLPPAFALVDGNKSPALACPVQTIIGGDAKSLSIAAASIVAKHYRDELMREYALQHPWYGWEKNAGYGTALHLRAMQTHGLTPLHRRSFAPVARLAA